LTLAVSLAIVTTSGAAPQRLVKFKTPTFPGEMVSAYGSIWVGTHRGVLLYRINPRTNRISARTNVAANTCWLGASGARVWVGACMGDNSVRAIDPATSKVVGRTAALAVTVGGGSLWVGKDLAGTLERIDPKTNVVLKTFQLSGGSGLSPGGYADDSLWVGGQDAVQRIDSATNTLTVIPLPGAKTQPAPNQGYAQGWSMAFTDGKAWIGNPAGIYEIDVTTNTATLLPIPIGNFPQTGNIDTVAGLGSVWARTAGNQVTRIDPATGGGGIAVGYGSLWVVNGGLDSVWREPIH
jgi:hypothetical protein